MPEHNPGQMGGTMRLGKRRTIFKTNNSILSKRPNFESKVTVIITPYTCSVLTVIITPYTCPVLIVVSLQDDFTEMLSMWMRDTDIALRFVGGSLSLSVYPLYMSIVGVVQCA